MVHKRSVDEPKLSVFVREPELLRHLAISRATLWRGIKSGRFPPPVKLGPRAVAWQVDSVQAWIDSQKAKSVGGDRKSTGRVAAR